MVLQIYLSFCDVIKRMCFSCKLSHKYNELLRKRKQFSLWENSKKKALQKHFLYIDSLFKSCCNILYCVLKSIISKYSHSVSWIIVKVKSHINNLFSPNSPTYNTRLSTLTDHLSDIMWTHTVKLYCRFSFMFLNSASKGL